METIKSRIKSRIKEIENSFATIAEQPNVLLLIFLFEIGLIVYGWDDIPLTIGLPSIYVSALILRFLLTNQGEHNNE